MLLNRELLNLFFQQPLFFFVLIVSLLYSLVLHEISHGWVAKIFGDDTAKQQGRLSLNPIKHLDPLGLVFLLLFGFGWAKPVPIDYSRLKKIRLAIFFIAISGCLTNFLIATFAIFLIRRISNTEMFFVTILLVLARINIILAAFNLIPLPPLDGSKVVLSLLPLKYQLGFLKFEPLGFLILIFLLATRILNPVLDFFEGMIVLFIDFISG